MTQLRSQANLAKRVLIVTPQPFFEERGTPIAVGYILRALSELGFTVDLIAFPVGEPLSYPRVTIHRVANLLGIRKVPIGFSLRKLFLDVALYFKVRELTRQHCYRYIHAVEEAVFLSLMGRSHERTPVLYDMASSLPEQLEGIPLVGSAPIRRLVAALEAWSIRHVDYVSCSAGLLPHVQDVNDHVPASEWWFPSVVHESMATGQREELRRKYGVGDQEILFVYTGSFAHYQGVGLLLEAVTQLHPDLPVRFLLIGATDAERNRFVSADPRVTIEGRWRREQVAHGLSAADVLLSPRLFGRNVPLKVYDYMGAGKPIVASNIPAHTAVLDESRAIFFENSVQDLAQVIDHLCKDAPGLTALGENSAHYAAEHLSWAQFREHIRYLSRAVLNSNEATAEYPEPPAQPHKH